MAEAKRSRGRPRPQAAIDRDGIILGALKKRGPQTRNDLAELLGESRTLVYLALRRLRDQGLVRMCAPREPGGDMLWNLEGDHPCP